MHFRKSSIFMGFKSKPESSIGARRNDADSTSIRLKISELCYIFYWTYNIERKLMCKTVKILLHYVMYILY